MSIEKSGVNAERSRERENSGAFEKLERSMGDAQKAIETLPSESEGARRLLDRFGKISGKLLRGGRNLLIIGMLAHVGNYYRTENSIETSQDQKGMITYRHPDQETTHILNYLAGRDELSEKEIERNFREQLKGFAWNTGRSIPDDFDSYSIEQVDEWMATATTPYYRKGDVQKEFAEYTKRISPRATHSENVYDLVWQLEQEAGNPKIRFLARGTSILNIFNDQEHYSVLNHTLYIKMYSPVFGLFAESAHSKQFRGGSIFQYTKNSLRGLRDIGKVIFRGLANADFSVPVIPLVPEQEKLYGEKGSIEYEAHNEIERELLKKYGGIIDSIRGIRRQEP